MDKKEIKKQYKQTLTPMGIFGVKNNVNGKIFIGKVKNLNAALNGQRFQLVMGSHKNQLLQNEWNEFGEKNFTIEVLDRLEPKDDPSYSYDDDLKVLEEMWLDKLQPYGEKGYHKKIVA